MLFAARYVTTSDYWRFQAHPEVWLLVAAVGGGWWYATHHIGPKVVPEGSLLVTRRQWRAFLAAWLLLWVASDWPIHDLGEHALYSVHMLQHMMLSYFMPPLLLLGTPTWLARLVVGDGRAYRVLKRLAHPVVAGLLFNTAVVATHVPGAVNAAVTNGTLHYSLHVGVVLTALLAWMPIVGPFQEMRLKPPGQMVFLFLMSVIPVVPAGWLTFADGVVYSAYDHLPRMWGISVTNDQQIAGVIMKLGGSTFLWAIITVKFFRWSGATTSDDHSYRRVKSIPAAEIIGHDEEPLTYADVERAFAESQLPQQTRD